MFAATKPQTPAIWLHSVQPKDIVAVNFRVMYVLSDSALIRYFVQVSTFYGVPSTVPGLSYFLWAWFLCWLAPYGWWFVGVSARDEFLRSSVVGSVDSTQFRCTYVQLNLITCQLWCLGPQSIIVSLILSLCRFICMAKEMITPYTHLCDSKLIELALHLL
jgi:hypothetical protein